MITFPELRMLLHHTHIHRDTQTDQFVDQCVALSLHCSRPPTACPQCQCTFHQGWPLPSPSCTPLSGYLHTHTLHMYCTPDMRCTMPRHPLEVVPSLKRSKAGRQRMQDERDADCTTNTIHKQPITAQLHYDSEFLSHCH